jgi:hypothetical protein
LLYINKTKDFKGINFIKILYTLRSKRLSLIIIIIVSLYFKNI